MCRIKYIRNREEMYIKMDMFIGLTGFFVFGICLIMLIVSAIKKSSCKKYAIGTVVGLVLLIAGLSIPVSSEQTNTNKQTEEKQEMDEEKTNTDTKEQVKEEPVKEEPVKEEPEEPKMTKSQENALSAAYSYLAYTAFSHEGLIEQLEYEQYSHEDAVFAADNCGADWKEQAAKAAESYLEYSSFSRGGLIDQLKYEGYTSEEAEYGVTQAGL